MIFFWNVGGGGPAFPSKARHAQAVLAVWASSTIEGDPRRSLRSLGMTNSISSNQWFLPHQSRISPTLKPHHKGAGN